MIFIFIYYDILAGKSFRIPGTVLNTGKIIKNCNFDTVLYFQKKYIHGTYVKFNSIMMFVFKTIL